MHTGLHWPSHSTDTQTDRPTHIQIVGYWHTDILTYNSNDTQAYIQEHSNGTNIQTDLHKHTNSTDI